MGHANEKHGRYDTDTDTDHVGGEFPGHIHGAHAVHHHTDGLNSQPVRPNAHSVVSAMAAANMHAYGPKMEPRRGSAAGDKQHASAPVSGTAGANPNHGASIPPGHSMEPIVLPVGTSQGSANNSANDSNADSGGSSLFAGSSVKASPVESPTDHTPPDASNKPPQDPTQVSTPERKLPQPPGLPKERKTAKDMKRCNSTSTIYLENTIDHPNNALTTICVAKAVHRLMVADSSKRPVVHPTFELTQSQRNYLTPKNLGFPSVAIIHKFLADFYRDAQLAPECNVVGFVYLIRFLRKTGVTMTPSNWRQLLYSCFSLSSKMYDDLSMINRDFAVVCPMFNLRETNDMELALLDIFRFDLVVNAAEYAAFYFRLQQEKEPQTPTAPLSKVTAEQLEVGLPSSAPSAKSKGLSKGYSSAANVPGMATASQPMVRLS